MAESYTYVKYDENYKVKYLPQNDYDRAITGKIVYNLRAYFDENPEEWKRLGWIKHIHPDRDGIEYNKQTQYLEVTQRQIDPWTITDEYHVMDVTEEMMRYAEMMNLSGYGGNGILWEEPIYHV